MVTIEESDDEKAIVTPEFRLKFRWLGDRWSHAIETPADPWITLAESVEWQSPVESPERVVSPTYQELHFQEADDAVIALLVGAAGPHHFSASVHVSWKIGRSPDPYNQGWEYPTTRMVFDVADRCRIENVDFECNYHIHEPPIKEHLGNDRDVDAHGDLMRDWRARLDWTLRSEDSYKAMLSGVPSRRPKTTVAYANRVSVTRWQVRIASPLSIEGSTRRMNYAWSHSVRQKIETK
ncbi:MAG: hypothetical protein JWN86_4515 [Planctomycetota bacterium]|nr:hypothetical protein [Planctomycetota bacterium]